MNIRRPRCPAPACRPVRIHALLIGTALLAGCAQLPRDAAAPKPTDVAPGATVDPPSDAAPQPRVDLFPGEIGLLGAEAASDGAGPVTAAPAAPPPSLWQALRDGYGLPRVDNPRVARDRRWWLRNRNSLNALLDQGIGILPHIHAEVARRGLPAELALLPAVESGFRPYAYSREGAAGLWQFMPATGRRYGLRQDWWYDARRDLLSATDAALTHLEDLHETFDGDWLHALAAYNAGAGKVRSAIRKNRRRGRSTAFWHLDLPGETDRYVPRLLALAELVREPGAHGIALPEATTGPAFVVVDTGGQIDLNVAAKIAGIELAELLRLNGGFNRGASPPDGPHRLLLPPEAEAQFADGLATLPESERLRWTRHRIKPGETLSHISRAHGISVKAIQRANRMKSTRIRAGRDLIIPLSAADSVALASRNTRLQRSKVRYRVRKGDSLYRIARKYKVKISSLRRWNALTGKYLQPGQTLTVYIDPAKQTL